VIETKVASTHVALVVAYNHTLAPCAPGFHQMMKGLRKIQARLKGRFLGAPCLVENKIVVCVNHSVIEAI
jgi:hypothetical protein